MDKLIRYRHYSTNPIGTYTWRTSHARHYLDRSKRLWSNAQLPTRGLCYDFGPNSPYVYTLGR
jgi:hypothetical protein